VSFEWDLHYSHRYYELTYNKREERHSSRQFDRFGELSLVFGTGRVTLGRINFSLSVHKPAQEVGILVIDGLNMFFAKMTLFHKAGDR
jgi:hypothetical protein